MSTENFPKTETDTPQELQKKDLNIGKKIKYENWKNALLSSGSINRYLDFSNRAETMMLRIRHCQSH